ncbi:ABC transporter permease subunit, partial [Cellulomonas iranensis]|uniref:ABC transporter permease subunit n=1 Tax=Cellulomonas iranensis TaxID=76862 RepID=UPI00211B1778
MDYIHAARSYGASDLRLIVLHILPNAMFPVLVLATMATGSMVLSASALSFLGVGTEEGYADWGQFIAYSRNWIVGQPGNPFQFWYTLAFPGAAVRALTVGRRSGSALLAATRLLTTRMPVPRLP